MEGPIVKLLLLFLILIPFSESHLETFPKLKQKRKPYLLAAAGLASSFALVFLLFVMFLFTVILKAIS